MTFSREHNNSRQVENLGYGAPIGSWTLWNSFPFICGVMQD